MRVVEAAEQAGVSETVIKRWLIAGRVAGYKKGKTWHVDADSLSAFLAVPRQVGKPRRTVTPSSLDGEAGTHQ
jgi:excisionase family DNA binding protein